MIKSLRKNSQVGATLAEFTLFLPIWITCLIGLVNLGRVGVESTRVQLSSNKQLWAQVIPVTTLTPEELEELPEELPHALPSSAAAEKGTNLLLVAFKEGNTQTAFDTMEASAHSTGLAFGHWGEGYATARGLRLGPAGVAYLASKDELEDITEDPADVLGKKSDRPYPHLLMNDRLDEQSFDTDGGIGSFVANLISGSGLVASSGAGIRYGDVFAAEEREVQLLRGVSFTTRSHIDMLVAPQPVHPIQFNSVTFGVAWIMTQSIDYYEVMPRFGKVEFGDANGSVPEGSLEDAGGVSIPDACNQNEETGECQE